MVRAKADAVRELFPYRVTGNAEISWIVRLLEVFEVEVSRSAAVPVTVIVWLTCPTDNDIDRDGLS
jgi:hypothetical protein